MTIYVVLLQDRHIDPQVFLFSKKEVAVKYARELAIEYTRHPWNEEDETGEEECDPSTGNHYLCTYSTEGDSVWCFEEELDNPDESNL